MLFTNFFFRKSVLFLLLFLHYFSVCVYAFSNKTKKNIKCTLSSLYVLKWHIIVICVYIGRTFLPLCPFHIILNFHRITWNIFVVSKIIINFRYTSMLASCSTIKSRQNGRRLLGTIVENVERL